MATRLRKKCDDCGLRGNWHKVLSGDWCPRCTDLRLHHDAILVRFYKRCTGPDKMCHPTHPPMCPSCTEYFDSETHAFFLAH